METSQDQIKDDSLDDADAFSMQFKNQKTQKAHASTIKYLKNKNLKLS